MGALRSTDVKDIEDKGDHYHFRFRLYDHVTFLPANGITHSINSKTYENLMYGYVRRYLGQTVPDYGFLDNCEFYKEFNLPYDYSKYHLLVPKIWIISSRMDDHSFEIFLDDNCSKPRLAILIEENRLRRAEKLKKIKDKICQV